MKRSREEVAVLIDAAEADIAAGMPLPEAAEKHNISRSQIYQARVKKRGGVARVSKAMVSVPSSATYQAVPISLPDGSSGHVEIKGTPQAVAQFLGELAAGGGR